LAFGPRRVGRAGRGGGRCTSQTKLEKLRIEFRGILARQRPAEGYLERRWVERE